MLFSSSWWRRDENAAPPASSSSANPLPLGTTTRPSGVSKKREALGELRQEDEKGMTLSPPRHCKMPRLVAPSSSFQQPDLQGTMLASAAPMEAGAGMQQQQQEQSSRHTTTTTDTRVVPTLAGQSRRQSAVYAAAAATNALQLLRSPAQPHQQQQQQKDCDVCPLVHPTKQRGSTMRHPQEVAAMALWAGGRQGMVQSPPQPTHHQRQHQPQSGEGGPASDCWISIGKCRHCERGICKTCLRNCESCQDTYCSLCSTVDYGGNCERVVCLDCNQTQAPAAASQEGGQDMDLS